MTPILDHLSLFMAGAFAFIFNEHGEILILRENEYSRKYDWDLPGGTLADEEPPIEGLQREVYEETSLTIQILTPSCFLKWDRHESGYPILVAFYLSKPTSHIVCLSDEHVSYQWINRKQLKAEGIKLPPSEAMLDAIFHLYDLVRNYD